MALDKLTTIQTSGIVATGIVTSNSFAGDGSGLTGVVGSGSGVVVQDDNSVVGTAGTIDFGTSLDVSAISSGIVTVTASSSGGSVAGIDTTATSIFSTLDIGADIDVDGHTELDNINIAGVTTFAGNIDANADIDIDGQTNLDHVSITGVTTFSEDVKFDGATAGRDITFDRSSNRLNFADSADATFGNSNDLLLYHSGSHSFVQHTGTGNLQILSNNIFFATGSGSEQHIAAYNNNRVDLYFNNSIKITTTNTGAVVTGILTATSFVGDGSALTNLPGGGSYANSDVDTHLNQSSASSGQILSWNGSDYAWVADNVGSGSTAEVRSNTLTVSGVSTFTGNIDANGDLDVDGHTNLDNVSIAGVTTFTEDVYLRDDKYIYLGNDAPGNDAKIYFDEYNLLIQNSNTSGQLYIRGTTTRLDAGDTSSGFQLGVRCRKVNSSLITEIYGGSTRRILTTNSGVVVTGIMTATSFSGDGSALTGISGSIAGISTTGTSNFANIQLIGITTGLNVSGVLTAAQFSGDGANLTSLPAAQLSGTAAAINGSNITNLAAANLSGTLPALDGSALTGIAVTEAPITNFTVTSNGSSAYRFAGGGVNSSSDDPDLYLVRGQKYRFNNTTGSNHPFRFRVSSGGSTYSSGVSGSENGVQFFMVPLDAPASLVYQCTIHSGMVGNIYIRGGSSTANISNNADNRVITGGSNGDLNGESGLTFDGSTLDVTGNYSVKDPSTASYVTHTFASNFAKIDVRGTNIANSNHYFIGYGAGHGSANDFHIVNTVGDLVLRNGNGNALEVDSNRNIKATAGNFVVGTADKGIDFSANSHLSGKTEEILNHYEVGTYVPTWTTIASSPSTYRNGIDSGTTSNGLSYVRIGKQVTITGGAFWSGGSSINNTRPNMSLPFPARIYTVSGTVGHYSLGETEDVHYLNYNTTTSINFYRQSANSGHESFGDNSDGEMYFNITYMTTD